MIILGKPMISIRTTHFIEVPVWEINSWLTLKMKIKQSSVLAFQAHSQSFELRHEQGTIWSHSSWENILLFPFREKKKKQKTSSFSLTLCTVQAQSRQLAQGDIQKKEPTGTGEVQEGSTGQEFPLSIVRELKYMMYEERLSKMSLFSKKRRKQREEDPVIAYIYLIGE